MEAILVDPINHGVIQPNLIDFSPVWVLGLGGGAAPGGAPLSLQWNNNGVFNGFGGLSDASSGILGMYFDPAGHSNNGSFKLNDGWGDIGQFWYDSSFRFDPGATGNPSFSVGANCTMTGYLSVPAVFHNGKTVASLSTVAWAGTICHVTDGAVGLAWGAIVTGGGTTHYLVWYNGTNWTVVGQ